MADGKTAAGQALFAAVSARRCVGGLGGFGALGHVCVLAYLDCIVLGNFAGDLAAQGDADDLSVVRAVLLDQVLLQLVLDNDDDRRGVGQHVGGQRLEFTGVKLVAHVLAGQAAEQGAAQRPDQQARRAANQAKERAGAQTHSCAYAAMARLLDVGLALFVYLDDGPGRNLVVVGAPALADEVSNL